MSRSYCILQGGNLEQHMSDDMIIPQMKNLENWDESGSPSIAFAGGISTVTYENNPKPAFKDLFLQVTGYALADSVANTLLSYFSSNPTAMLFCLKIHNSAQVQLWMGANGSYYTGHSDTDKIVFKAPCTRYTCALTDTTVSSITTTNNYTSDNESGRIGQSQGFYDNTWYVCTYSDTSEGSGGGGFEGYIEKDFTVESGKKYYFKFTAWSTSGFTNASNNNVVLTSGENSENITLDGSVSSEGKEYAKIIESDGTTLNVKIDLPTMTSANNIVLKFYSIELYKLGT